MEKVFYNVRIWTFGLLVAGISYGCASSGGTKGMGNPQVYSESFTEVVAMVEQAVKGAGLNVIRVFKSEERDKITFLITKNAYIVNNESVPESRGQVIIQALEGENRVQVEVKNPEYHYSVPRYQRERYDRIIFRRMESIMEKSRTNATK